jgi:hypothetical protein
MSNMKIMKIIFYLLIVLVLFISSCIKQANKISNDTGLAGTWQWVSSDGGISNNIHNTPSSTGKNIDLIITSDNKYFLYTNSILTSQGTYVLEIRSCIHDHKDKTLINFSSAFEQDMMVEKLDKDHLELSDEVYDGTGSSYKRKASNVN